MARRNRRRITALALGAVTALPVALAPAAASAAEDPLRRYERQQLRWERCDAQQPAAFECATVVVPLDYARPAGRTIDVAVSRVRAGSARERHGVLLMNPGGPGGPGLELPVLMAPALSPQVRERFDLVGFDPRGVGRSSPVSCGLSEDERGFQHPYAARTFGRDTARAKSVADKCRAAAGDVLPHLTTRNTARDMDLVRAVLGERRISYFGHSYGTYLGAVYTQLFPQRADRFVLDSAVDPALVWRSTLRRGAQDAEAAFTRWTGWAAARDAAYGLGATPAQVRGSFWELVARADRTPVPTEGGAVDGDAIRAQYAGFVHVEAASAWVVALRAAAAGGPAAPAAPPAAAPDNAVSAAWSVFCGDAPGSWPRDPEQYRRDALRDRAAAPLAGDLGANIVPCAFWPRTGGEPPTAVDNGVGALIVQNRWDPQTPPAMAGGMRRALHGSRMVTVAGGEGHGVVVNGPSCADDSVTRYLTTGRLPARDLTCG